MARTAPTIVGLASTAGPYQPPATSGNRIVLPVPGGAQVGDVLIAALSNNDTLGALDYISDPPGFTRIGVPKPTSGQGRYTGFFMYIVNNVATVPSSVEFYTDRTNAMRFVGSMFLVRGVDLSSPVAGYSNSYTGTTVTGGASAMAYSVDGPARVFIMGANESTSGIPSIPDSPPAGYSLVGAVDSNGAETSTRTSLWVGTKAMASAGVVEAAAISWGGGSGARVHSLALRGRDSATPPPAGGGGGGSTGVVIIVRNGTAQQIAASTYILQKGEMGVDTTNGIIKIGDGTKTFANLKAIGGSGVVVVQNINSIPAGTPAGSLIFQAG